MATKHSKLTHSELLIRHLQQARALADALRNHDPEVSIDHDTVFHLGAVLTAELDTAIIHADQMEAT